MCTVCPHSPGHWTDSDRLNPGLVPDVQLLPVSPVQIGHSDGAPARLLVVRGEVHVFGDPVHRESMQTQCSSCKQQSMAVIILMQCVVSLDMTLHLHCPIRLMVWSKILK